ncbi:MAG: hypothetical protein QOH93_3137 [Chloroflexia bacterium]|jgi:hypothetical protein|nr:hypothetical protein [Chloroflexia bacterium]
MVKLFTTNSTKLTICVAVILLSPLIAFGLLKRNQSDTQTNMNREQYSNTSNISRDQYDTALTKWNNLHVTDYEATIRHSNWGKWKIGVHVDHSYGSKYSSSLQATYSHRITLFEGFNNGEAEKVDVYDSYAYEGMTVGGLFDYVSDILYCQENSCQSRDFFTPSRYIVEFDQTMGYPRSITSINDYATVETRIENVKVLK